MGGKVARVREGLVELVHGSWKELQARLTRQHLQVVLGPQRVGGQPGEGRLVEARLAEPNGEAVDAGRVAHGQGRQAGGIHATGKKNSDRHVRHQPLGNGGVQQRAQLVGRVAAVSSTRGRGELPVPADAQAGGVEDGEVRGGKLLHLGIDGARSRHRLGREVLHQRLPAQGAWNPAMGDQRLELGAEDEPVDRGGGCAFGGQLVKPVPAMREGHVQRLLSHPVAAKHQLPAARVPQRDGEHSLQPREALFAPLEVGPKHHLGIASCAEGVAVADELGAQCDEVVGLPVEDQGDALALHRLHATGGRGPRCRPRQSPRRPVRGAQAHRPCGGRPRYSPERRNALPLRCHTWCEVLRAPAGAPPWAALSRGSRTGGPRPWARPLAR